MTYELSDAIVAQDGVLRLQELVPIIDHSPGNIRQRGPSGGRPCLIP